MTGPTRRQITLLPEIVTEPLGEHYRRRAEAYGFVRHALEQAFGADALGRMCGMRAEGPTEEPLSEELDHIEQLFRGAHASVRRAVGLPIEDARAASLFDGWARSARRDPDFSVDVRMMVPIFYDRDRHKLKVWAILGWAEHEAIITYARLPRVRRVLDSYGRDMTGEVDVVAGARMVSLALPVFVETYVQRPLDREEMQQLCNTHKTRRAILAAL